MAYAGLSCAGLAAGEIRSIGDAARAGVLEPFAAKLELVGAVLGCAHCHARCP